MIKAVFFDMNESLLDMRNIKEAFGKYFTDPSIMPYWFSKMLHVSLVVSAMGDHKEFADLASNTLENVFYEKNQELTEEIKKEILGCFRAMKPYDDVIESFKLLRANGIKVIPVTNSSLELQKEQLKNAGLTELTDSHYSVDSVRKYKPLPEIYIYVAEQEGIKLSEAFMVATHDWDLYGAKQVGLNTAYIRRKRTIYNPYYDKPDISSDNLVDIIKEIIDRNK